MTSLIEIKKQAKNLKLFLSNTNQNISLSSCYQAIAKMNGYRDWNTMSADLEKQENAMVVTKSAFISNHINLSESALLKVFVE